MKGTGLGAYEEVILLTTAAVGEKAYAVSIKEEVEEHTGRSINISSVHTTLYRLEEKGYLESELGGATAERGGRRKRFFRLTDAGRKALSEARNLRTRLWKMIPNWSAE